MRTTIELPAELHESVRRQALRQNTSMAKLLGQLVERGLRTATADAAAPTARSGRFQVIAPATEEAHVTSERLRKLIDEEGIL